MVAATISIFLCVIFGIGAYRSKRIEKILDKRTILENYLNLVEWGENIYGAEAASHYYFDKSAAQLDLAESSLLAGILPNPIYYNPFKNFNGSKRKQYRVLRLMRDAGLITNFTMQQILNQPVKLRGTKTGQRTAVKKIASSFFDSLMHNPQIPDSVKKKADSTGIIYLPEENNVQIKK